MRSRLLALMGNQGVGKDVFAARLSEKHAFMPMAFADEMKRICARVFDFTPEQLWGPSEKRNEPDPRYPKGCPTCKGFGGMIIDPRDGSMICPVAPDHLKASACPSCKGSGVVYLSARARRCNCWAPSGAGSAGPTCGVRLTLADARILLDKPRWVYTQLHGLLPSDGKSSVPGVVITDCRFLNEARAVRAAGGFVLRLSRPGRPTTGVRMDHPSETEQKSIPDSEIDGTFVVPEGIEAYHAAIDAWCEQPLAVGGAS